MMAIDCAHSVEGDGPPLFLIHGIGAARDTWRFLMPTLVQHFTVVSYDLRGHGDSPGTPLPFELEDLVADLEALRDRLGIPAAHFAGHSLGGMIGPAYARAFPKRVKSLGILSTAAFRTPEDGRKVMGVVDAMRDNGIPNILPTLKDRWYTDAFLDARDDIVQRRMAQVIGTDAEVFLEVFRIYATFEMGPWLDEVTAPSLVLTGQMDGGCSPRLNTQIAAALPDSELVILEGLKHSILLEAGDVVADHMVRFINSVEARG